MTAFEVTSKIKLPMIPAGLPKAPVGSACRRHGFPCTMGDTRLWFASAAAACLVYSVQGGSPIAMERWGFGFSLFFKVTHLNPLLFYTKEF